MNRMVGRFRAVVSISILGLAAATAATAAAVDVRGTIRVASDFGRTPPVDADEAAHDRYWDEWNGFLEPRPRGFDAARDLAVVLTGEGEEAPEQPGFAIANGGMWPTTLVARTGSTIELQNSDPMTHRVFAEGHDEFGEVPIAPGRMRPIQAPAAGNWPIHDRTYEHVRGHLHVIDDLIARAEVTSAGAYHFRNVPAGTYTLKIFHGAEMVHSQEGVVVAEEELTIEGFRLGGGQ